jgi:hypothetical protein
MNNDPQLGITLGNKDFEVNRRNAVIYTFMGELAIHDHLFLITDTEERTGIYVFRTTQENVYNKIGTWMAKHNFTAHLNLPQISENDLAAWQRATSPDLGDFIPDDWDGTAEA